jgi:hypothetical protein
MAVNLSPYGGVGAQFLDNSGNVLTGGKIFTYAAGTTTNQATYTTSAGDTPHSNPIILDASGRVPGGEIWLTDGSAYKFILRDSNDVLIATYDNVTGINSNFVAFTNQQEIQTATAGQTVFNLTTTSYAPSTNSLSVFVDGVNQYGPGAQYAYLETDGDTVTFVNGLHVGAEVKFTTSQLNSSASQSDAFQVSYTPPFTGSVTTNVGDKLAETVSVTDFGAVGDGVTDDTAAITAALAASKNVYFPIPTVAYQVSTIDIPAGSVLQTENINVKFKQIAGQPATTSVFYVIGSNVTIGDMTIEGNIATDTLEFNHAINIYTGYANTALSNISVGNIKAVNIRGDGILIGQVVADGLITNVRVASVDGDNVLRNVVSIVGGSDIEIGQVTGSAVGFYHVDIEPDATYTGGCTNVHVGQVRGRHIGVVSNTPTADIASQNIRFDEVWLDPAFATQSTPAYSGGASIAKRAVHMRNVKSAFIGSLRVNGFDGAAIWETSGGIGVENLFVDQCVLTDCAKNDSVYDAYVLCNNVTFGYLSATTETTTASPSVIYSSNNNNVLAGNFVLTNGGSVLRSTTNCTLQNCVISALGAINTQVLLSADNSSLKNCTISNMVRLAGFLNGLTVDSCTATLSSTVLSTVTKAVYIRSTIQGQYYAFATGDRTFTEAIAFGSQFLWVDSTGDLRIKSGAPTSDTDGTVVGTQT